VPAWINLVAGAKADVYLGHYGVRGDGALSPAIGNVVLKVRD
jgi:hypothetical protein